MDYEKAYKEVIEKAKSLAKGEHPECFSEAQKAVDFIFPELKESEDDKMRTMAIKAIYSPEAQSCIKSWGINPDDVIDWLGKQSKCKSVISYDALREGIAHFGITQYQIDNWLKKYVDVENQGETHDKGEISDGYHTFNELYYYRMLYNAAFFNMLPKEWVHKSKKHHDGEECFGGGWFIVMANLPTGQISNHYELKDWDLFQIPEKDVADKWDGHTSQEAADRLHKYLLEKQGEQKPTKKQVWDYCNKISSEWWQITMYKWNTLTDEEKNKYNQFIGFNDFSDTLMNITAGALFQLIDTGKLEYEEGSLLLEKPDDTPKPLEVTNVMNEKQCEQKPDDKVGPKFKVGDWVVNNDGSPFSCGEKTLQITDIDGEEIWLESKTWTTGESIHLWTITDAKDGDVLVTKKGNPFLYDKNRYNNGLAYYYVGLDVNKELVSKSHHRMLSHFGKLSSIYPATKEQRDLLSKKMHEAGYEWDFEKKELKKIEQKPDWSEDDEKMENLIIKALTSMGTLNLERYHYVNLDEVKNWLKSLKERYTWKSSDLPHWKKSTLPNDNTTGFNSDYFCHKGYNINYKELFEKLPKDD